MANDSVTRRGPRQTIHVLVAVTLAAGMSLLAGWQFWKDGYGGRPLVVTVAASVLLFLPYFSFGLTHLSPFLQRRLKAVPSLVWPAAVCLLGPRLLYGWGTGTLSLSSLLVLGTFLLVPTAWVLIAGRMSSSANLFDMLAVVALWVPFDCRWLEGLWPWPEGRASYGLSAILAVDLGVLLFVCFRRLDDVGYRFRLRGRDARVMVVNFLLLSAIAIPLGLQIEFIAFQNRAFDVGGFLGSLLAIGVFTALPEELLFRGLIQNMLQKWLGKGWLALGLAALIFGAAHINNPPAPNWSYFLMASIAGVFYGLAYRQSGGLVVPAAVHALVDAVWRAFFR